ncbi:MAG TPA: tyrosine-protein phosphatase [Nocardioidaceae bacterium]|nr:tyrosine-protein phosphatase [Nocardioidaceae bacterium]
MSDYTEFQSATQPATDSDPTTDSAASAASGTGRWVTLDGAVNARDLGGLPLPRGGATRQRRLLRSDNLQDLSPDDVRRLRDTIGVSDILDLRTTTERTLEGEAPLDGEPGVTVHHLSLLPRTGDEVREVDGDVLLPWQQDTAAEEVPVEESQARSVYTRYLLDRPESVVAALSTIAHAEGAVVVHCAAGKDRTGVIVALALDLAGVARSTILADYLLSGQRIDAIIDRLSSTSTYAANLRGRHRDSHLPKATAITDVFALVDGAGGTEGWLIQHGWRDADTEALRRRLTR